MQIEDATVQIRELEKLLEAKCPRNKTVSATIIAFMFRQADAFARCFWGSHVS